MRPSLGSRLAATLPFHYGSVVLGCVVLACLSRAGPAVATLSIFLQPMTEEFGSSRTALAGAVSLGGVLAAIGSPMIGTYLDRQGARVVLSLAVLATGVTLALLSTIGSIAAFYVFYCVARMCWAGPYDLGIHGTLNNWFVRRRTTVASVAGLAQTSGLIITPLLAFAIIERYGWRTAWLVIGLLVLAIGFLPASLLLVRRPEDVGLLPDWRRQAPVGETSAASAASAPTPEEPAFTRAEAMRTGAFWALSAYTVLIYPVQAGMSLHQAAHLVERGLTPAVSATAVTVFTIGTAVIGFGYGVLRRRLNVRVALVVAGLLMAAAALAMARVTLPWHALVAATLFGLGIGGVHVVLPVAWADTFGRKSFGAIRGVSLSMQVTAQATGPLLSGVLRDLTGDYQASLMCFAVLSGLGAIAALATRAPMRQ